MRKMRFLSKVVLNLIQNSLLTYFRKFASGLHEPLGLAYKDGVLYTAQRGELTKLVDADSGGKADLFETVYSWPLSGHYHEYSYGPRLLLTAHFSYQAMSLLVMKSSGGAKAVYLGEDG